MSYVFHSLCLAHPVGGVGAPAPDPLSDLSPRSRADPVVAQVSSSKEPRQGTPGDSVGGVEMLWTSRSRRRWCWGVVDGVEVLLELLTTLLNTWASASVSVSVIAEGTKGFSL